jgi:hypothetical protein
MLIDCDTCAVRNLHCGDCVVTVLLGNSDGQVELDSAEQDAIGALASGGLLPPLRLVAVAPPVAVAPLVADGDGPSTGGLAGTMRAMA